LAEILKILVEFWKNLENVHNLHESEADLYLVWILQTLLILLKFSVQKYLRLGGNGDI
jgi:hypothetical protein